MRRQCQEWKKKIRLPLRNIKLHIGYSRCRHGKRWKLSSIFTVLQSFTRRLRHLLGQVIWPQPRYAVYNLKMVRKKKIEEVWEVAKYVLRAATFLFTVPNANAITHFYPFYLDCCLRFLFVSVCCSPHEMKLHWNYDWGRNSNAMRAFHSHKHTHTHNRIKQYRLQ